MAGYLGSTPVPQATQHRESFTCTEGQTSFATAGYTPQFLDVFLNGSHLSPADFVATNSSDVVLVVAASADDICDIVSYTPFEVADATFTGTTTIPDLVVSTVTGTGMTFSSPSFNVIKIQTDSDDNGSNDDAILQFTNGSGNTVKGELRFDESTSAFEMGFGDNQGHVTLNSSGVVINEDSRDHDFRVESNGNTHMLFVDGGSDHVNIGTDTDYGGRLNIKTGDNSTNLVLVSTDADANSGPVMNFYRNSGSPAAGDSAGLIEFIGKNDAGQDVTNIQIEAEITDASDGSEDIALKIGLRRGGAFVDALSFDPTETVFNDSGADVDFRVESNDIPNMLFVNAGTNQVGIGGVPVGVAPLHVEANFTTNVTNAATMIAATTFSVNGNTSEGSDILRIGPVTSGGAYFIEVSNGGGSAVYPLLLNPINGGRVGINTLAPENTFHVSGQTNADYAAKIEHAGAAPYGLEIDFSAASPDSSSREFIYMQDATESKCIIHSTGDITNRNGTFGQISDVKLKENIVDANSQWDDLKALRVRNFSFKTAELDAPNMIGLIAQEVEAAGMNGLVGETPDRDEDMEETGTVTKNVKSSILYMKAIKALQEAMTRIETLEAKVAVLEG